jgi:serine/threonine protein kinase
MAFNALTERPTVVRSLSPGVVFRDGLGERRHIADSARGVTVELLCVRPELTSVSSFEFALRERINRLATFRHAYYAPVRGVERVTDPQDTLAIVSDVTPGIRLSELLASLEERHIALNINAALCLIRQIVPAVAMLHENARDVAHGAIAPERLIVTPNARLVLVDYVLGAALEQLRFSHERYWSELAIALPRTGGAPRFDHRADVLQIGIVALSLILGRALRRDEYPSRVRELVANAWSASTRGGFEPLPPGLCAWLGRTLQLEALTAFPSAIEARAELDKIVGDGSHSASPAGLQTVLARYQGGERSRAPAANTSAGQAPAPAPEAAAPMRVVAPVRALVSAREPLAAALPLGADVAPTSPNLAALDLEPLADPLGVNRAVSLPDLPPVEATPVRDPSPVVLPPRAAAGAPKLAALDLEPLADPVGVNRSVFLPDLPPVAPTPSHSPIVLPALATDLTPNGPRLAVLDRQPLAEPLGLNRAVFFPDPPLAPPAPGSAPSISASAAQGFDHSVTIDPAEDEEITPGTSRFRYWKWLGGVAVVLSALVVGGALTAKRVGARPSATATGTLVITTNPAGARAVVDGQPRGTTPLTIALPVGTHRVELLGAGAPRAIPVTIAAGMQVAQYIDLPAESAPLGQLQVRTEPTGARVIVDGSLRGTSPVLVSDLAPGDHTVVLETSLGSVKQNVTVGVGTTASLVVPLGAQSGAVLASGWIAVSSPLAVQVYERGRFLGTSYGNRILLPAGTHEIDLVNDDLGYRASQLVDVQAGKGATIHLDVPKGTIALNALPWAEVWIDGEKVGETPIGNLSLAIGPHDVVFRHPDLGDRRETVVVSLKNPARVSADLRKK